MSATQLTPAQLAEQAGNVTAHEYLTAIKEAPTQAVRVRILIDALNELIASNGFDVREVGKGVAKGYATALICTLELGLGVHQ
jgi:hypothetical protein